MSTPSFPTPSKKWRVFVTEGLTSLFAGQQALVNRLEYIVAQNDEAKLAMAEAKSVIDGIMGPIDLQLEQTQRVLALLEAAQVDDPELTAAAADLRTSTEALAARRAPLDADDALIPPAAAPEA